MAVNEIWGGIAKVSNAGSSTDAFRSKKVDIARKIIGEESQKSK